MDILLQKRIFEFEAAKPPKNLSKFVCRSGRQRSDFKDPKEWDLYAALYKTLISIRGHEHYPILANRLFEYLDRHPPSLIPNSKSQTNPLSRKEKKLRRAERRAKGKRGPGLAEQLKKAKPSTATMIETWKSAPVIGLGLESRLTPAPKARREDVKIDRHTRPINNQDRPHILYAAGWSLNSEDSST
ncbi:hypothetical protein NPS58_03870 [Pseudomonas putida]|uniref:hypothetical protein n=1 Tax=Pseudomonas putida TaxID=303 RepID=UPI002364384B|nr:hypothetical protein [Pseudomonas putida]MDD2056583.1 hypothetical protein [Pseudomonas putida]